MTRQFPRRRLRARGASARCSSRSRSGPCSGQQSAKAGPKTKSKTFDTEERRKQRKVESKAEQRKERNFNIEEPEKTKTEGFYYRGAQREKERQIAKSRKPGAKSQRLKAVGFRCAIRGQSFDGVHDDCHAQRPHAAQGPC